ncbi:MAG: DUF4065 domain-containing protein [Rhodobacteraceae bacterium]|nr:DUF4065 domain-containing protein [Paracoccaceae bacterium]
MPYPYKSVVNAIINKMRTGTENIPRGENISPLKLQKLLYYTCGYYLAASGGAPLIDHNFKAWEYGPVVPELYRHFSHYGNRPIATLAHDYDPDSGAMVPVPPPPEGDPLFDTVLDFVVKTYGPYTALQLSEMTHADDSPWDKTRKANPGIRNADIDRGVLLNHFEQFVEQRGAQAVG